MMPARLGFLSTALLYVIFGESRSVASPISSNLIMPPVHVPQGVVSSSHPVLNEYPLPGSFGLTCECRPQKDSSSLQAESKPSSNTAVFQSGHSPAPHAPAPSPPPSTCDAHELGLYANVKEQCKGYYFCSPSGVRYEFWCPRPYLFSDLIKSCDQPTSVICGKPP